MVGANGTSICVADTDPANPACSACAADPASCHPMHLLWLRSTALPSTSTRLPLFCLRISHS